MDVEVMKDIEMQIILEETKKVKPEHQETNLIRDIHASFRQKQRDHFKGKSVQGVMIASKYEPSQKSVMKKYKHKLWDNYYESLFFISNVTLAYFVYTMIVIMTLILIICKIAKFDVCRLSLFSIIAN